MPKSGNKSTEGNAIPTLAEYITTQIANKRSASLSKSRNRTMPAIPIINGTPNRNSCIYTATDNYGNQYRVPGNWTFYENPGKYGFKPVSLDQAVPGDIIQVFDKGAPYHAMTLDSFDEQGRMKYNYSRGSSGDESDIVKASINFPNTKKAAYTFVGTQADSTQWANDYKRLYGNQMKCGGRRKAQLGLAVTDGGTLTPIGPNMYLAKGRTHDDGGIGISYGKKYNAGGDLEIEDKEILQVVGGNTKFVGNGKFKSGGQEASIRVFSSVPFLRGASPAELVLGGANPDDVFKAQEEFKDRNRINDDGTTYENGGNKIINLKDIPSSFRGKKINGRYVKFGIPPIANKAHKLDVNFKQRMSALNDDMKDFVGDGIKYVHNILPTSLKKYYLKGIDILNKPGVHDISNAAQKITQVQSMLDEYKMGGLSRSEDYGSKKKPYPSVSKSDFAGGHRSYPMPTKADAIDALRLAGLHGRSDVKAKVYRKYPELRKKKEYGGEGNVLPEVVVTGKKPKTFFEKLDDYADIGEKALAVHNLALSGASLISPNPITLGGAYLTNIGGALLDLYQGGRAVYKGDWFNVGKNVIDLSLSLIGLRALKNANKLNELDKSLDASGAAREYVSKYVGRGRGKHKATFTKEKNEAIAQEAIGYASIPASTAFSMLDTDRNKKEYGGNMIYTINGNVKNGLSLRPKARFGEIIKIDRGSYETIEEAVERYKQLYRIKYGKEPSEANINRIAWTKALENSIKGDPNLTTGYGPNVGVRGPNVTKIVSGANKGRQIARTQTVVRNKNVKSATPQKQAINTKVSQAARNERLSQFEKWQQGEPFNGSTMPTDAVAVNRPNIGTSVRSGRKGRVDDVVAIERSQRSVDPLSSKSEFNVYDKAYAKKVNSKMNQFTNALLASGVGGVIAGNMTYDDIVGDMIYDETPPVQNNIIVNNNQTNKSVNSNIKTQSKVSNNTSVKGTNNDYISTTKPNTGESYVINPLTGEWIRNGVTETSEPSVKGATKVTSKSNSTARGRGTKTSTPKAADKTTTKGADVKYGTPLKEKKENLYITGIKNNSITPLRAGIEKIKSPSSTGGGTQSKDGRWIGQYKTTNIGDWIGLGSNLAGSVASYFMTKNAINKTPEPIKPVMAQAAKLKTRYNVEPQLTNIREAEQMNRAAVRRNTQSSNTSLAREQRLMNEVRGTRNTLYGQKENIETQLINQDKVNRQTVYLKNIDNYNNYLNRMYLDKQGKAEARISNINNLISGLTGSVNNILGNIETRRATNNTLRAIAAANPNVDARLIGGFDYYIDPITKKKYNKNQQYVGTINS